MTRFFQENLENMYQVKAYFGTGSTYFGTGFHVLWYWFHYIWYQVPPLVYHGTTTLSPPSFQRKKILQCVSSLLPKPLIKLLMFYTCRTILSIRVNHFASSLDSIAIKTYFILCSSWRGHKYPKLAAHT